MILTARNIPLYLVEQGVVSLDSVVDGQLTVVDVTRRNRNFKVTRRDAPGFFVKQAAPWDPQAHETVRCDARCHWLAHNTEEFRPLAPLLPPFHRFDLTRSALTVGLIPHAETLNEYHQRLQAVPSEIAVALAQALAAYHRPFAKRLANSQYQSVFARRLPWILSATEAGTIHPAYSTQAGGELLQLVRHSGIDTLLQRMRESWRADTLIHGDMKWENCLVVPSELPRADPGTAPLSLRVIDWEIADLGDPAWDAGSVFQAYLAFWLFSIPVQEGVPPSDLLGGAPWPLSNVHPAMRAFWSAYAAALNVPDDGALLQRTLGYTAARLLQTAYESLFMSQHVTPHARLLLHVATVMLQSQANALAIVFGS